jgi:type I restriction enzyme R subunit
MARHTKVMEYFKGMDLKNIDECIASLKDDIRRAEFEIDFKNFLKTLNGVLPDSEGTKFIPDMKKLGRINQGAKNLYRDEQLNIADVGEKVRALINEHIFSEGIDPKIPPTKLFDGNFIDNVQSHKETKTQALEMEYAIKKHIDENCEQNPDYYRQLSLKLKEILQTKHEKWEELVQLLLNFRSGITDNLKNESKELGLSETEYAFFLTLRREVLEKYPDRIKDVLLLTEIVSCVKKLVITLEDATQVVDFFNREGEKKEVMKNIRRTLGDFSFCDISEDKKLISSVTEEFMRLAEVKFKK